MLKLIGYITMFIDHIGIAFFPYNIFFRIVGRISFPIFAYLLVLGYRHTHSKKNYAKKLAIFSICSQPFYFYFIHYFLSPNDSISFINIIKNLNIGFTLMLGLLTLYLLDTQKEKSIPHKAFLVCIILFLAYILHVDYGIYGILVIINLYEIASLKINKNMGIFLHILLGFLKCNPFIIFIQSFSCLFFLLIPLESKKIRYHYNWLKKITYWIYPIHFMIIVVIDIVINKIL